MVRTPLRALFAMIGAVALLASASVSAQQGPMPVDVAKPLVERVVDWDEFTGRFEAVQRVELRARVSGYLQEVKFRDGALVSTGDTLFLIDRRPFEAAYERALGELQAAQAEQTRATTELQRGEQLVRNRNIAESALDERRATKLRADAEVVIAEAELREAALNLEFTEIKAPFDGRISDSRVDKGNLITLGETVLATLVSNDPIHLVFTASEADFLKYSRLARYGTRPSSRSAPNPVQARLIDEEGWPHRGRMDFVANELDPNAGTITGRAVFDNPDDLLTPGLFARLRLIGSGEYEAFLVPDDAILSDQDRKMVMVVDDEGFVAARIVEPGPLYRGLRIIRSGLDPAEQIIVAGVQRARPGGQVAPQVTTIHFPDGGSDTAAATR